MRDLHFNVSELLSKSRGARTDVPDLDALRKIDVPQDGTSFMIDRKIYIFLASDRADDDGVCSIRPNAIPATKLGRYRRGALGSRQKA